MRMGRSSSPIQFQPVWITRQWGRSTAICATFIEFDYDYATDSEALAAFRLLAEVEGILPALESAHAVAHAMKVAPKMRADQIIIINLSGRGDKDVAQAAEFLLKDDAD